MNPESQTMVNELLSYLYGSFLITYILCIVGILIREVLYNAPKTTISIKRIIFSTIPVTAILCMVQDRLSISFPLYVLLCIIGGSCSGYITNMLVNSKLLLILLKSVSKTVKDPVVQIISNTAEEITEEMDKEEKDSKKESDENKFDDNKKEDDKVQKG